MKSLKIWIGIGVVVVIGAIVAHGFLSNKGPERKVNDKALNEIVLNNTENSSINNTKITKEMNVTKKEIKLDNGISIPVGTYEAPIELSDGLIHTDYLITGMVTSNGPIQVYNRELQGPIKTYQEGTNLLVIGYVDGYFVLGSAAGDVDGLGYKTDTLVKASEMNLIPNESNLYALTLGNAPYKIEVQPNGSEKVYNLYEYPTDLSKVVAQISPNQISYNPANNTGDVINTANKMNDIRYKGEQGWLLTSDQLPIKYIGQESQTSVNNGSVA